MPASASAFRRLPRNLGALALLWVAVPGLVLPARAQPASPPVEAPKESAQETKAGEGSKAPAETPKESGKSADEAARALGLKPALPALDPRALAAAPAEQRAGLEALDRKGRQAYAAGRFDEADRAFSEAYALRPIAVFLLLAAESRQQAAKGGAAIEALQIYLKAHAPPWEKEDLERRLALLRAQPATLMLRSTPEGASVSLDGKELGRVTPLRIPLETGKHALELKLRGYLPATREFEAQTATGTQLHIELQAEADERFGDKHRPIRAPLAVKPDSESAPTKSEAPTSVWVSAGIAGGALLSGTILGFLALSKQSEFNERPSESLADRGERLALFSDLSFGVALAAAVTSLVLYFARDDLDASKKKKEPKSSSSLRGSRGVNAGLKRTIPLRLENVGGRQ